MRMPISKSREKFGSKQVHMLGRTNLAEKAGVYLHMRISDLCVTIFLVTRASNKWATYDRIFFNFVEYAKKCKSCQHSYQIVYWLSVKD